MLMLMPVPVPVLVLVLVLVLVPVLMLVPVLEKKLCPNPAPPLAPPLLVSVPPRETSSLAKPVLAPKKQTRRLPSAQRLCSPASAVHQRFNTLLVLLPA